MTLNFLPTLDDAEKQAATRLYHPFPTEDHDSHPYFKFIYLKEEAINRRLTEVFGVTGWSKIITSQETVKEGMPTVEIKNGNAKYQVPLDNYPGRWEASGGAYFKLDDEGKQIGELPVVFDVPYTVSRGYMTVRINGHEARRDSVGADILTDLGKERGSKLMNTDKASDTDLFKRLARQFGVGLYLTEAKGVTMDTLRGWIWEHYGPTTVNEAKRGLAAELVGEGKKFTDAKALGQIIKDQGFTDGELLYCYSDVLSSLKAA